jgi:hypothetical protein
MTNLVRTGAIIILAWTFCEGLNPDWLTGAQAQTKGRGALISNLRTEPASPRTGDKIRLLFDASEDLVRAEITWSLNGTQVGSEDYDANHTDVVFNHPIQSGDVILATIVPYEAGGGHGKKIEHRIVCGNAPPILSLVDQSLSDSGLYKAKIDAKSPQGGAVNLKVEQAPRGLTMDPTGNIEWKVDKNTSGKFSVKVVAEDSEGQKSFLTYEIGIRWQK